MSGGTARLAVGVAIVATAMVGAPACDRDDARKLEAPSASVPAAPPMVDIQGVEVASLTPGEKSGYAALVRSLAIPCGDKQTIIAECAAPTSACRKKCVAAAQYVARSVHTDKTREQIERGLRRRFDPAEARTIAIDGSPTKGPEGAAVTVVVFMDFTNGACQKLVPILERAQRDYDKYVRLVLKLRPKDPARSEESARRALAAGAQGKFWEMTEKLLDNPYEVELVTKYVKDLSLDEKKFVTDLTSDAISSRLERDKHAAELLGITAIPTTYVNGHELDPTEEIDEWIAREIP
jgi:protein-disulfide isomerase